MSDRQSNLLVWAVAFVVAGLLLLLFNLDVLARYEPAAQYVVAALLGVGGLVALVSYFTHREQWWRLMPGWTLLALATMVLLSLVEGIDRAYIAATLFVGLALAFTNLYLVNRGDHWWAIIPGGFMLVLALVISLAQRVPLETLGAVLFAGMGLVFALVYLLAGKRRHWWALIPAGVLLFFGLLTYSVDNTVQSTLLRWWPAALIVIGAAVAFYATTQSSPPQKLSVNVAPSKPSTTASSLPAATSPATFPETTSETPVGTTVGQLGDYSQPAPGASVEVLPDLDRG